MAGVGGLFSSSSLSLPISLLLSLSLICPYLSLSLSISLSCNNSSSATRTWTGATVLIWTMVGFSSLVGWMFSRCFITLPNEKDRERRHEEAVGTYCWLRALRCRHARFSSAAHAYNSSRAAAGAPRARRRAPHTRWLHGCRATKTSRLYNALSTITHRGAPRTLFARAAHYRTRTHRHPFLALPPRAALAFIPLAAHFCALLTPRTPAAHTRTRAHARRTRAHTCCSI